MGKALCCIRDCPNREQAKDFCSNHYRAWRDTGHPLGRKPVTPRLPNGTLRRWLDEQAVAKSVVCIPWPFAAGKDGRGSVSIDGRRVLASHYVLTATGRPRPNPEAHALHACDNGPCVNPAHLRWGTALENSADAVARGRLNPARKLSKAAAAELRARYVAGEHKADLARAYGVSPGNVSKLTADLPKRASKNTKLTDQQMDEIARRYIKGTRWAPGNSAELAAEYGVHPVHLRAVARAHRHTLSSKGD